MTINPGSFEGGPYLTKAEFLSWLEDSGLITSDASGNITISGDLTASSGEIKAENLEVTGTAKFDGTVEGLPDATAVAAGVVKQVANIAQLSAAPTMADFNGLITALQTAGIMAAS
ncbi:head fiber protein [Gluconobacter kondonii]|uniref:head fiber protein n=1 Tax=Gluconobacter kondonii TaxID=941463 RepID=UPI001B8B77A9|nr:head fiber protein [Gluconobacter kondonii]MBS1079088.1 hypothetical protein [Gluconobacter kondonii]